MFVIFVTLFNVFDEHREKYAKPDFVKFISFEIIYFVEPTVLFLKNIDKIFFQETKINFPSPFFLAFIFYSSLSPFA